MRRALEFVSVIASAYIISYVAVMLDVRPGIPGIIMIVSAIVTLAHSILSVVDDSNPGLIIDGLKKGRKNDWQMIVHLRKRISILVNKTYKLLGQMQLGNVDLPVQGTIWEGPMWKVGPKGGDCERCKVVAVGLLNAIGDINSSAEMFSPPPMDVMFKINEEDRNGS